MSMNKNKLTSKTNSEIAVPKDKKNKVTLRIENVVASVKVGTFIDLNKLLEKYKDIEKKENFPGLVVKMKNPKATRLIFSSGKMVCTGVRLVKHLPIVVEKVVKKMENAGIEIEMEPEVKIENIVVRGDFHQTINLDLTSLTLTRAIYEPEVFPGLIYKIPDPKVCFLIFSSGRIICTGANDEKIIRSSVKKLALDLKRQGVLGNTKKKVDQLDLDLLDLF